MITQEYLKTKIHYNPETGVLTRIASPRTDHIGSIAGCVDHTTGYIRMNLGGKLHYAHRLAWLYMTGSFPLHIDHMSGDRQDNRIVNLRSVTRFQNLRNAKRRKDNTSGVTGIHTGKSGKWHAEIGSGKTKERLGVFSNWFEAVCARKSAEVRHGYHVNHGRTQ